MAEVNNDEKSAKARLELGRSQARNTPSGSKPEPKAGTMAPRASNLSGKTGLNLLQNRDRNKPLEQQARGQLGKTVGRTLGGTAGSYVPVVGTAAGAAVGGFLGKVAAESKVGKWVIWGTIICVILGITITMLLIVGGIIGACKEYGDSWLVYFASFVNPAAGTFSAICKVINS